MKDDSFCRNSKSQTNDFSWVFTNRVTYRHTETLTKLKKKTKDCLFGIFFRLLIYVLFFYFIYFIFFMQIFCKLFHGPLVKTSVVNLWFISGRMEVSEK